MYVSHSTNIDCAETSQVVHVFIEFAHAIKTYEIFHYITAPNLAFVLSHKVYSSLYIPVYTIPSSNDVFAQ